MTTSALILQELRAIKERLEALRLERNSRWLYFVGGTMSEYPWDIENMMLAQHDQPCDCAICDEIHFNRETRRKKRQKLFDEVTSVAHQIATLQEALAKTQTALHVAESQKQDKWIETGLLSEQKRNDLLWEENVRLEKIISRMQCRYTLMEENQKMKEALQKIAHCNEPYPLSFCMNTARAALEI